MGARVGAVEGDWGVEGGQGLDGGDLVADGWAISIGRVERVRDAGVGEEVGGKQEVGVKNCQDDKGGYGRIFVYSGE